MKNFSDEWSKLLNKYVYLQEVSPQLVNHCRKYYQRNIIESKVQNYLEKGLDGEYHLGILAKRNPSSELFSINGQHHCEAALRLGKTINYYIVETNSIEEEKDLFDKFAELQKSDKLKEFIC